jgi:hypothetical protein
LVVQSQRQAVLLTELRIPRFGLDRANASNPVPVAILTSTDLFTKYVAPYLTPFQIANPSLKPTRPAPELWQAQNHQS